MREARFEEADNRSLSDQVVRLLRERLPTLRFGTISLTVHDGRLTQIDVTEKRRFGH